MTSVMVMPFIERRLRWLIMTIVMRQATIMFPSSRQREGSLPAMSSFFVSTASCFIIISSMSVLAGAILHMQFVSVPVAAIGKTPDKLVTIVSSQDPFGRRVSVVAALGRQMGAITESPIAAVMTFPAAFPCSLFTSAG